MKSWKKLTSFILAVMLAAAAGLLTGCGGGDDQANAKAEISVAVFDRGEVPAAEGSYQNNRWTRWMNEDSGITVNWIPIPRNEARQKYNMLVAAGEAPDLIVDYDIYLISSLVKQGALQPIDEYIDKYSTVYKKYLEENPDLRDFVTYDGKMYAVTSKRSIDKVVNHGMWIRQDWLDKLGLKTPETDGELLNVARAFRDGDPDGNGVKDTTAFAIQNWHEIFFTMYQASGLWYDEGGELKYGGVVDRYADALEFFKKCYDENLIDHEFITDKDFSRQKQLWVTEKSGILTNTWQESNNRELLLNNPDANPAPLRPVSTKYGLNGLWQEVTPNLYAGYNKSMKNPEAVTKFVDWMLDKGWFTLSYGEENVNHRMVDGIPQSIDVDKNKQELNYMKEYPFVSEWQLKPEWIPVMAAQDQLSQVLAGQRMKSLEVNISVPFRRDLPVDPQLEQVVKTITDFSPARDEIRMKVIVGGAQYTPGWGLSEIRKEWKRLGGEDAEKLMTEWYKEQK
jgi:putative aldouronate transport system substrate-binding protein